MSNKATTKAALKSFVRSGSKDGENAASLPTNSLAPAQKSRGNTPVQPAGDSQKPPVPAKKETKKERKIARAKEKEELKADVQAAGGGQGPNELQNVQLQYRPFADLRSRDKQYKQLVCQVQERLAGRKSRFLTDRGYNDRMDQMALREHKEAVWALEERQAFEEKSAYEEARRQLKLLEEQEAERLRLERIAAVAAAAAPPPASPAGPAGFRPLPKGASPVKASPIKIAVKPIVAGAGAGAGNDRSTPPRLLSASPAAPTQKAGAVSTTGSPNGALSLGHPSPGPASFVLRAASQVRDLETPNKDDAGLINANGKRGAAAPAGESGSEHGAVAKKLKMGEEEGAPGLLAGGLFPLVAYGSDVESDSE